MSTTKSHGLSTSDAIVAGTGHRPNKLGGYSDAAFAKLVKIATAWLAENKPLKVISGMALGWDQALAQAALNCDIPFIAAVPFKGQEAAWPKSSQDKYFELLEQAQEIVYVSQGGYAPYKMQIRNEWMVNNCNLLLTIWDGTSGGTANCITYAKSINRNIRNLYPEYDGTKD